MALLDPKTGKITMVNVVAGPPSDIHKHARELGSSPDTCHFFVSVKFRTKKVDDVKLAKGEMFEGRLGTTAGDLVTVLRMLEAAGKYPHEVWLQAHKSFDLNQEQLHIADRVMHAASWPEPKP